MSLFSESSLLWLLYGLSIFFFFFHWRYSPLWALACPFFPIYHQLSPSSDSQHLKTSSYFFSPSFPGPSPSFCPFQFLSEDLFWASYPPFSPGDPANLFFAPLSILLYFSFTQLLLFHSPSSYLGPYILINIFFSKICREAEKFSSSSIGATARCGLWPVEQYLSIFSHLSPPLSIFLYI